MGSIFTLYISRKQYYLTPCWQSLAKTMSFCFLPKVIFFARPSTCFGAAKSASERWNKMCTGRASVKPRKGLLSLVTSQRADFLNLFFTTYFLKSAASKTSKRRRFLASPLRNVNVRRHWLGTLCIKWDLEDRRAKKAGLPGTLYHLAPLVMPSSKYSLGYMSVQGNPLCISVFSCTHTSDPRA